MPSFDFTRLFREKPSPSSTLLTAPHIIASLQRRSFLAHRRSNLPQVRFYGRRVCWRQEPLGVDRDIISKPRPLDLHGCTIWRRHGSTFSSSRQRTQAPAAPAQYRTSSGAYRAGHMRPASALLIVVLMSGSHARDSDHGQWPSSGGPLDSPRRLPLT